MTPSTEREIVQFTASLHTKPAGRFADLLPLAEQIVHDVGLGLCIHSLEEGTLQIGLSDARIESLADGSKALAMLFDLADPFASVAVNRNMETRAVRRFDKRRGEGRALSAHMVMALQNADGTNRYKALVEVAAGLGQSRIKPHLQRVLRRIFEEREYKVEDADGKWVPARPQFEMEAVHKDKLREDIGAAEISELVLIQAGVPQGEFDAPGVVKVTRREMRLKVDKTMVDRAEDVLRTLKPWAKDQGYNQVYVRWRRSDAEMPKRRDSSLRYNRATIDLQNADIGETLFARRHFVTLNEEMVDCTESLRDDMVAAMVELL